MGVQARARTRGPAYGHGAEGSSQIPRTRPTGTPERASSRRARDWAAWSAHNAEARRATADRAEAWGPRAPPGRDRRRQCCCSDGAADACCAKQAELMAKPATGAIVEKRTARGTSFALRFRAYGERRYVTLGTTEDGWNRARAEDELQNVLADVRRGIWSPLVPSPRVDVDPNPTFHTFASEWFNAHRGEWAPNTVLDYEWQLRNHLLPVLCRSSAVADHDRRGRPLPPKQGRRRVALRRVDQQDDHPPRPDSRGRRRVRAGRPQPGPRQPPPTQAEGRARPDRCTSTASIRSSRCSMRRTSSTATRSRARRAATR